MIYLKVKIDVYNIVVFENCHNKLKLEIAKNYIIPYCKNEKKMKQYLELYKYLKIEKKDNIPNRFYNLKQFY